MFIGTIHEVQNIGCHIMHSSPRIHVDELCIMNVRVNVQSNSQSSYLCSSITPTKKYRDYFKKFSLTCTCISLRIHECSYVCLLAMHIAYGMISAILSTFPMFLCNSSEPMVSSLVRAHVKNSASCHELFGFDIILDRNLKAWILEVNISPRYM